jgi:O-antigen/teichoic acid export membrane protein
MFPAFATSFVQDRQRTSLIFGRSVKYVFLILFPIVLGAVALGREGLTLWLGVEFAEQSTTVLHWLALGVFLNGLAQVPSALTQAVGRPDIAFKLHLIELPLYLVTAWYLIGARGIEGAAIAWTARTALDLVLFFAVAAMLLPGGRAIAAELARALAVALPALGTCALPASLTLRVAMLATSLALALVVAWRRVLSPEEKSLLMSRLTKGRASPFRDRALVEMSPGPLG